MQATAERSHSKEKESYTVGEQRQTRDAKRRRITRKGTHSCWACKRRKERCSPDPSGSNTCNGCRRRGTECVSQEFAEETPTDSPHHHVAQMGDRMQRIEAIVEQILFKLLPNTLDAATSPRDSKNAPIKFNHLPTAHTEPHTSASLVQSTFRSPHIVRTDGLILPLSQTSQARDMPAEPGNLQNLSRALHRSMPHRNDIRLLCQISSQYPTLLGAHLTRSYTTLQCHGLKAADGILGEPPLQTVHPVLIARYMLQLAIMLQDMHLEVQSELSSLSESVSDIMQRCANAAVSLVTTRDEVLGSIESLECVMLESVYRCNSGHLKLSWIAARRAMILAQTMGLHLQDAERKTTLKVLDSTATHVEPQTLWFRIVTYDLLMCRMLGLPPGITDAYSAHFFLDPGTALGHLENKHCNIMNQILKRKRPGSGLPDFEKTLLLDQELQRAAKAVPSDWWLAPHLSESSKDPVAIFWDVRRLLVQTIHYDLFNQLYVPYMLDQGQSATDRQRCNLSRIVCVNSSREVLSRYILLRNFNHVASSCRIVDFMGLMASITLALAHLGGRHQLSDNISVQSCNLLLHQAPSDRAMMEEALKRMRQVSQLSGDAISARSADTLRRLMDIESETADHEAKDHINVHAELVSDDIEFQNDVLDVDDAERIDVPYFGFIRIIRERENLHSPPALTMPVEEHHQNTNDTAAEHYTLEPGLGKNVSNLQPPLHSYGTIPPDLNDEHWDFQNIHLSFLDDFFDNLPRNETIRDS